MPAVYDTSIAVTESLTTANLMYTTSATPGNLVDHLRFQTGAGRGGYIQGLYINGRAGAATTLTGISVRFIRLATLSTVGTAASIRPRDPVAAAAIMTAFTGPTIGSGAVSLQLTIGCGKAGPGQWIAPDQDSKIVLGAGGGANGNCDMISGSQEASLSFDATVEHSE